MTASETQVVKFDITEAGIAALKDKYANPVVPTNKDEYDALKVSIKEVATIRIAIDNARKEQGAAALAHQRAVNKMGNGIIDRLKEIEAPMKLCKQEVDDAEDKRVADLELAEEARLSKIHTRIENIIAYGVVTLNDALEDVKKRLTRVEELDPTDQFDEFAKKAADAKQASIVSLNAAIDQLTASAELAKDQAERQKALDKQADEQKAAQKIIDDENERIAKVAADKEADDQAEELKRVRKLEDDEAERKALEDAAAEEKRQAALAPDKEKLRVFAQSFRDVDPPVMSSDEGKMAIDRVVDQLTVIVSEIESEADRL